MMNKLESQSSAPEAAQLSRWDVADYLEDLEDIVVYLEVVYHEADPDLIKAALDDVARAKGMAEIAAKNGLERESLSKAFSSSGDPKFTTIVSVLKLLGIRLQPTLSDSFAQQVEVEVVNCTEVSDTRLSESSNNVAH